MTSVGGSAGSGVLSEGGAGGTTSATGGNGNGGAGGAGSVSSSSSGGGGAGGADPCGNKNIDAGEECDGSDVRCDQATCMIQCLPGDQPFDGPDGQHCYEKVASATPLTWQEALDACAAKGLHLATLIGDAERAAVQQLCPNNCWHAWLGGKRCSGNAKKEFTWIGGAKSEIEYGWIPGEPDLSGTCLEMSPEGVADRPCSSATYPGHAYICERSPGTPPSGKPCL